MTGKFLVKILILPLALLIALTNASFGQKQNKPILYTDPSWCNPCLDLEDRLWEAFGRSRGWPRYTPNSNVKTVADRLAEEGLIEVRKSGSPSGGIPYIEGPNRTGMGRGQLISYINDAIKSSRKIQPPTQPTSPTPKLETSLKPYVFKISDCQIRPSDRSILDCKDITGRAFAIKFDKNGLNLITDNLKKTFIYDPNKNTLAVQKDPQLPTPPNLRLLPPLTQEALKTDFVIKCVGDSQKYSGCANVTFGRDRLGVIRVMSGKICKIGDNAQCIKLDDMTLDELDKALEDFTKEDGPTPPITTPLRKDLPNPSEAPKPKGGVIHLN